MNQKKYKPTFLLRATLLIGPAILFALVFLVTASVKLTLVGLLVFYLIWTLGLETGLLFLVLEPIIVRKADRSGVPGNSLWLKPVKARSSTEQDDPADNPADNPAAR